MQQNLYTLIKEIDLFLLKYMAMLINIQYTLQLIT
jgi:hypothetical protein